ncbi:MAG: L,D-transpeptidase family protein [Caulobacteraceae bacterium]
MTAFRILAGLTLGLVLAGGIALAAGPELSSDDIARIEATLETAPDQGFGPDAFGLARAKADLASSDAQRVQMGRSELAEAAIAYAAAQHGQRLAPAAFEANWAIRPEPYDARAQFAAALADGRLAAWLAELPPPDPAYPRLVEAYRRYTLIAANGGWPRVPGKSKPGDSGPAVAALSARLAVEDPTVGTGPVYDDALKAAVTRAEVRLGLNTDGVAGPLVVAALDVSAEDRVQQIAANLERRRWMPRTPPPRRAEVNIADASLTYTEPGQPLVTMRVVVGQPKKRTPSFMDHVTAVVLNPPWNVPPDIARKEIWPKIRKDPGYMEREGFVVRPNGELQQLPGERCALGAIKFDLGNPFGVYLHDTPAKSLFGKDRRALSHGCMRMEQPNLFAKRLLADQPQWPPDSIDAAILVGKTVRIPLKVPPAVHVTYWTVLPGPDGSVGFRADIYGWDKMLMAKLPGPAPASRSAGKPSEIRP